MSNPTAASVARAISARGQNSRFARVAAEVQEFMSTRVAAVDRDAEWQRVHSYIADVLKDAHVLYAKLARLEGDFAGEESANLERISEAVLTIGEELSHFSKAFYEGKYSMQESGVQYGAEGGAPIPATPEFPQGAGEDEPFEPSEEAGEAEEESGEEEESAGEAEEEAGGEEAQQ